MGICQYMEILTICSVCLPIAGHRTVPCHNCLRQNKTALSRCLFWRRRWDLHGCSASAGLRLPFRSACPAPYSTVHRTVELHARALSGSNPFLCLRQNKTAPSALLCFGGDGGIRTHVPLRTTAFRVRLVMTTSIRLRILICWYCRRLCPEQMIVYPKSHCRATVDFRQTSLHIFEFLRCGQVVVQRSQMHIII